MQNFQQRAFFVTSAIIADTRFQYLTFFVMKGKWYAVEMAAVNELER